MKLNADIDVISTEEEAQSIVNGVVNNIISYSKAQWVLEFECYLIK